MEDADHPASWRDWLKIWVQPGGVCWKDDDKAVGAGANALVSKWDEGDKDPMSRSGTALHARCDLAFSADDWHL